MNASDHVIVARDVYKVFVARGDRYRRRAFLALRDEANQLMRRDQAAAVTHLRKYFPRTDPDLLALALREIIPALSEDGRMNEQMMDKHLQFMLEDGQISLKPSAKDGILWTNKFITGK